MTSPAQPSRRHLAFREAIREHVCDVCLDQRDDGSCGLTHRPCAIERHLPRLAQVLSSVESGGMDAYEGAMRAGICCTCPEQDAGGRCALREEAECALYAYLPLVLEAFESATEREAGR